MWNLDTIRETRRVLTCLFVVITCFSGPAIGQTASELVSEQESGTVKSFAVFVSSVEVQADFGGVEAGDAICQAEAEGHPFVIPAGKYLTWLSDGVDSPDTRFTKYTDPIVLLDGTEIASDYTDLTDGTLNHPINLDAEGRRLGKSFHWTGTNTDGTVAGSAHCAGWTSKEVRGAFGNTAQTGSAWSIYQVRGCWTKYRLLCFQQ
jgi:hypothetical protein